MFISDILTLRKAKFGFLAIGTRMEFNSKAQISGSNISEMFQLCLFVRVGLKNAVQIARARYKTPCDWDKKRPQLWND